MKLRTVLALTLLVAPLSALAGCKQSSGDMTSAAAAIVVMTADDLAAQLTSDTPPIVFDANSESTRDKYGVIPGAILLSDNSKEAVQPQLPESKADALVFYCGSTMCSSAEGAAEHAVEAGYQHVAVMRDGIKGWAKSGKQTAKRKGS